MDAVIEARGLTKDFGAGRGLFDLDLRVAPGRVHGFLGPNGAGKTTCIRLLLDFLRPTRGEVRVLGRDPRRDAAWIRSQVGYLPGELALPEHLTGGRFLADSAELRGGVDADWRDALVDRLGADLEPKIRTLSRGNKQKIALVDALQHHPPLLILDEPTDGLDPLLRHRVHALLRRHAKDGGTVFLSSHVVHEIQTTCDDVSIVLDGTLRHSEQIAALLAREPTRIELTSPDPHTAGALLAAAGATDVQRRGDRIRFLVHGELFGVLEAMVHAGAYDVDIRQHDLEETFLRLYREGTP